MTELGLDFNMRYNYAMNFLARNFKKALFAFYFLPVIVFAEECDPSGGKICDPLGGGAVKDIPTLIHDLLVGALRVGMPIIALSIIYSGFLFVAARGNSEKLSKAKDTLLYTLIGAAILLGSWAIAELIKSTVTSLG